MSYTAHSLLLLAWCQFLIISTNAFFNCSAPNQCIGQTLSCSYDGDECGLYCGESSCDGVTLNCPSNAGNTACHMICGGINSCENAVLSSTNPAGVNLECNNQNACRQMTVTSISSTNIQCDGSGACNTLSVTIDVPQSQSAFNSIACGAFTDSCQTLTYTVSGTNTLSALDCAGTEAGCANVVFNCTATAGDCGVNCASATSCDSSQLLCNANNACTSNEMAVFPVIGGLPVPTSAPSAAPTMPAVLQNYVFVDNATDWFSAQAHCRSVYGSNLATIIEAVDIDNINMHSNASVNRWIGLNNYYQSAWQWVDGTACDYVIANSTAMCTDDGNWATNQPNDTNKTCGVMTAGQNGLYSNVNCNETYPFLCQLTKRIEYICVRDTDSLLKRVFKSIGYDEYVSNGSVVGEGILTLSILNNYWRLSDEQQNTIGQCHINGTEFILPTECLSWQWLSVNSSSKPNPFINATYSDCAFSGICIGEELLADPSEYVASGLDVIFRQYEFNYFDMARNGPVYYSPANDLYIYPITDNSSGVFVANYTISNAPQPDLQSVYAFCTMDNMATYDDISTCEDWGRSGTHFRSIKATNCIPTPFPTAAPTLTPQANYLRLYCYYPSDDPLQQTSFNLTRFVNAFRNITLTAINVGFASQPFKYITGLEICDVFVNYSNPQQIVSTLNGNCPFVLPPNSAPPPGPFYAAANFKIYASDPATFGKEVIYGFNKDDFRSPFVQELYALVATNLGLDEFMEAVEIYVFNLNASESPTTAPTVIPTQSPSTPFSTTPLIFKCLYNLQNFDAWKTIKFQLFAAYLTNATLHTFYQLFTSNDGYLSNFEICAVFNDQTVNGVSDECPDYDDSNPEAQFSAVALFDIKYNGLLHSFKSLVKSIFESSEFKDELTNNMNTLLSSSVSRRLLAIGAAFSVVDITIIDPADIATTAALVVDGDLRSEWLGNFFQIALIGMVSVFTIIIILAYIVANYVWVNHFFRVGALMSVAIHVLDMLTDVFFTIHASFGREEFAIFLIFILSACFIFIPILTTIIQLWRHMKKHWMNDDKLRSWLSENTKLLYFVSFITGSSFTAIELFNTNLFGLSQFDMGLSRTELMGYQYKRIYSIVLLENFPQLCLQAYYVYLKGGVWDFITPTSLTFTAIAIIVAIISMVVEKQILFNQDLVMIEVDITGASVVAKADKCRNVIRLLHEQLSTILGLNKRLLEIVRPNNIPNGLKLHLNIHIVNQDDIDKGDASREQYEHLMFEAIKRGQIQSSLMQCWQLDETPFVSNLSVTTKDSKKRERMYVEGPGTEMIQTHIQNQQISQTSPVSQEGTGKEGGAGRGEGEDLMNDNINEEDEEDLIVANAYYNNNDDDIDNEVVADVNTLRRPASDNDIDSEIVADVDTLCGPAYDNNNNDIDNEIVADVNTIGGPFA